MDPRVFSAIAAVILLGFIALQRRVVVSFSVIGAFFVVNIIIILTGVLSFSFFPDAMSYGSARLWLLQPEDIRKAIALNVGGAILIVLSYQLSHFIFTSSFLLKAPNLLRAEPNPPIGFSIRRVLAASACVVAYLTLFVLRHRGEIIAGISEGLIGGSNEAMVSMRKAIGSEYASILVVFNVAPFIGVALWLWARPKRAGMPLAWASLYALFTVTALLFTLQKRPALLFMLSLLIAEIWVRTYFLPRKRRRVPLRMLMKSMRKTVLRRAIAAALIVFTSLMLLYHAHSMVARGGDGGDRPGAFASAMILARVAFTSVIYGLSIPSIMHVHYFPAIEPFYGIRNLRPVAAIANIPRYENTVHVYELFYGTPDGSIAIPAVMDFYGAFGLAGWLAGTIILGLLFERVDFAIGRLAPSASRTLIAIFAFVFAYYLSHASLANSLMGYGGGIFVVLWIAFSLRIAPARHLKARDRALAQPV